MMMSEFIDRTGFEPTASEYEKIEKAYYDFDGDKDAFCKAFVKDDGARKLCKARAAEIDRLNSLLLESERQYKKDIFNFLQRFAQLRRIAADLDRQAFDFIVCHAPHSLQSSGAISPGLALFVPCARHYSGTPAPPLCGSVRRYTHRAARSGIANSPSGRPQQSSGQYTQTQAVSTRT